MFLFDGLMDGGWWLVVGGEGEGEVGILIGFFEEGKGGGLKRWLCSYVLYLSSIQFQQFD